MQSRRAHLLTTGCMPAVVPSFQSGRALLTNRPPDVSPEWQIMPQLSDCRHGLCRALHTTALLSFDIGKRNKTAGTAGIHK